MTLVLIISLVVGFQAGQVATKKELAKDKSYFCYTEGSTKKCFDINDDVSARKKIKEKNF